MPPKESVLSEMTRLALARPAVHADTAEIAQWYEAKALLHEHLAEEATGADAAREQSYAAQARTHAQQLHANNHAVLADAA